MRMCGLPSRRSREASWRNNEPAAVAEAASLEDADLGEPEASMRNRQGPAASTVRCNNGERVRPLGSPGGLAEQNDPSGSSSRPSHASSGSLAALERDFAQPEGPFLVGTSLGGQQATGKPTHQTNPSKPLCRGTRSTFTPTGNRCASVIARSAATRQSPWTRAVGRRSPRRSAMTTGVVWRPLFSSAAGRLRAGV